MSKTLYVGGGDGGGTWRLAWRTHRERRCADEDPPAATLLPVFPSPFSPSPPSSSSSSSPSTVTLMLISGLLGRKLCKFEVGLKTWPGWPYSPWKSGHAEIFCARRLGMVTEGNSPNSHGARRDNQERDSWAGIYDISSFAVNVSDKNICLQRCCWSRSPPVPLLRSSSGCGWAICWGWVGSHWCLSEGWSQSAGRRHWAREGANSDRCCDHFSALLLLLLHLLVLLHLLLVLLHSSHLGSNLRLNSWTQVVHGPEEDIALRQVRWNSNNKSNDQDLGHNSVDSNDERMPDGKMSDETLDFNFFWFALDKFYFQDLTEYLTAEGK